MSRDGSGTYSLPSSTLAVSGDPISSTKFNTLVQDLEADANVDRPIAAGGTGASTASAARTNLGLAIGTDVQAFDAGLLSIAGLTTAADRSIYTTASDTYAVYTLTAAGRAILDDADASAQRTTLGLGTAAVKNTGTSGDAVPLLNVANTFSAQQTVSDGSSRARLNLNGDLETWRSGGTVGYIYLNQAYTRYLGHDNTNYVAGGNIIWHAGNDGAGSGLDADTVDGAHVGTSGATIPLLNAANTFSAAQGLSNNIALNILETGGTARSAVKMNTLNVMEFGNANNNASFLSNTVNFAGAGDLTRSGNTIWHAGNDGAGSGLDADTVDGIQASAFATLSGSAFTGAISISYATPVLSIVGSSSNIVSLQLHNASRYDDIRNTTAGLEFRVDTSGTPKSMLFNTAGGLQVRVAASTETTGTLTVASANETIQATGDITIPNAVFAAGDIILIYAGASARTITQGASVTMRLGGTATTGSRTLAARGVAMLFFVSSSEVIVSGGAVT